MGASRDKLLTSLLRDVSRSFYLTLWVLPRAVRPQIGLAYLLARATDTIADTELVPLEKRLTALQALRDRILGASKRALDFGELAPQQASPAEKVLLLRCEEAVALVAGFSEDDQQRIRRVLATIISGQEMDLLRFGRASADSPAALRNDEELDDYTYRVAGCVGEFWTVMCLAHLFREDKLDERCMLELGVRFGKGLQLVNILRDIPADLRRGRCYLPEEKLQSVGLGPGELLNPANELRLRPCYDTYLDRAAAHLHAGWRYTNMLPSRCWRVRLACAWPVLIGLETLDLLRTGAVLDPKMRIKVSRGRVRKIMFRSLLFLPHRTLWRGLVRKSKAVAS